MSSKRYTEEFMQEAVKQVTGRGHKVADVTARLGVSTYSPYDWMRKYSPRYDGLRTGRDQQAGIRRLKAELKRVTEERDILKNTRCTSPGTRSEVAFISRHKQLHPVRWLCRLL